MKLAVTDACIFIDLCEVALIAPFFLLDIEVHTSVDVFNELYPEQQQILRAYQSVSRLTIHNISPPDRVAISQTAYPKSLSEMDKTVLHLAIALDAMILSSDGVVRNYAKGRSTECHGMLWILDRLLTAAHLSPAEAVRYLRKLMEVNSMYRDNAKLAGEIGKRLKGWE